MLNSAKTISQLGYNVRVLNEGFNNQNIYEREAPFDGHSLKHYLNEINPEEIIQWHNKEWRSLVEANIPKHNSKDTYYILDGKTIEVPGHLVHKYQGAGTKRNEDDSYSYGYKAVWVERIIPLGSGEKGYRRVIIALLIGPIQTHDLVLARRLFEQIELEKGAVLICDRGFIDGQWITHLKKDKKIDVFMPLRRDMNIVIEAVAKADLQGNWTAHPTRLGQLSQEVRAADLKNWKECKVLKSGTLVRWERKDGKFEEVLFVSTRSKQSVKRILEVYDKRTQIEESHKQLVEFQGLEKIPSKKYRHIVFHIVMEVVAYDLLNLFLMHCQCKDLEEVTLRTIRQRKVPTGNADVIIYTRNSFGILSFLEFVQTPVEAHAREKIRQFAKRKAKAELKGKRFWNPLITQKNRILKTGLTVARKRRLILAKRTNEKLRAKLKKEISS